jgi:hypothetical protein
MATRTPAETSSWSEVFINPAEAGATPNTSVSLALGHSLLVVHALCSDHDCDTLLGAASSVAARFEGMAPAGANSSRFRLEVANPALGFSREVAALCDSLLLRTTSLLESSLPGLVEMLFGPHLSGCTTILGNTELSFTPGEPAVRTHSHDRARTTMPVRSNPHHRPWSFPRM